MDLFLNVIKEKYDKGFETYACRWAYCLHDKDVGLNGIKKPHYHLMLEFFVKRESIELYNVLKDYLPNKVHEDLNKADSGGYAYLIHANAPKKVQYEFTSIVHSENLTDDDLYDLIESHRRKTTEFTNAERIEQLFNFVDDVMGGKVSSFKGLILKLMMKKEYDLLGWCSKNTYLINNLFREEFNKYDKD